MTPDLGNRSSAFNIVYPTNNTGVLQVENIGTVDNVLLATYRAIADGVGYVTGDIIQHRQVGSNPPQYYNNDTVIGTPDPNDLGPLSLANNVIVTSTTLPTGGATSALQTTSNALLTNIIDALPTAGVSGTPSSEVISVQGVAGGTPVTINGAVTSILSASDNLLLNDIKTRLTAIDNKLVTDNPIGAVRITNGSGVNAVTIQDGNNSITVDGALDLTGTAATNLSNINTKVPSGLAVSSNRLLVDNTQQVQPISGTVTANTGLSQPLTDGQLRATPPIVELSNLQLNTITPPAALTNVATETTLLNVLDAVNGNVNFNETIWTDDSGLFFARRVTQTGPTVTVNYYLPNGSGYTLGLNPKPVFTDNTKELITTYYLATVTAAPNYTNTNNLARTDVLNTTTSTIVATIWFNITTQTYIPTPNPEHVQLISTEGKATAANQVLLLDAVGTQGDSVATTDTGSFSLMAFIKRSVQNWTTLFQRIPTLGQKTSAGSISVTLASDQATLPVNFSGPITVDTTLLAKETGGNLESINTKLPASLGIKSRATSLSITSPTEGLDVRVNDGTNTLQLLNLVNSKPVPTAIVDAAGNQINSFGGGIQYTEGDVDTTITGTAMLWENTGNTLSSVSNNNPLPVNILSGVDTSLLAREGGGNLAAISTNTNSINTKLPTSLGPKTSANSLSVTSPTEGLNVKITDGTNSIQLLNLTASKPVPTAIVDASGNQITNFGGGIQYTEGDVDTTITGTVLMWEGSGNTINPTSTANPIPVNIVNNNTVNSSIIDNTAFTPTVSLVTALGGFVDDTAPTSVSENRVGSVRMSPNRALHVNLRDASGNEITTLGGAGAIQYLNGSAQATPTGIQINWNEVGTQRSVSLDKALPIQPGTGAIFPVTQSGTWNINNVTNITGTISLPTGASTAALQTSGNSILTTINTAIQPIGTATENTIDVDALALNPALSGSVISLLKTIAVTNKQLSTNSESWGSLTLTSITGGFDKLFTVPANTTYHVLFGNVSATTNSSIANRLLKFEILNVDNSVIYQIYSTTYQEESLVYSYNLSSNESVLLPSQNFVGVQIPPSLILYAGQKVRAVLIGGVTGDQLSFNLQVGVR
jgi:hypothetical protein